MSGSEKREAQTAAEVLIALASRAEEADAETMRRAAAELLRQDRLLNRPSTRVFTRSVMLEAAHQSERWGWEHDAAKTPDDWHALITWLAGKAAAAQRQGNTVKAKHHTISSAAALSQWHAHLSASQGED